MKMSKYLSMVDDDDEQMVTFNISIYIFHIIEHFALAIFNSELWHYLKSGWGVRGGMG